MACHSCSPPHAHWFPPSSSFSFPHVKSPHTVREPHAHCVPVLLRRQVHVQALMLSACQSTRPPSSTRKRTLPVTNACPNACRLAAQSRAPTHACVRTHTRSPTPGCVCVLKGPCVRGCGSDEREAACLLVARACVRERIKSVCVGE